MLARTIKDQRPQLAEIKQNIHQILQEEQQLDNRGRRKELTTEEIQEIGERTLNGELRAEIAKDLGFTKQTIYNFQKKLGLYGKQK